MNSMFRRWPAVAAIALFLMAFGFTLAPGSAVAADRTVIAELWSADN